MVWYSYVMEHNRNKASELRQVTASTNSVISCLLPAVGLTFRLVSLSLVYCQNGIMLCLDRSLHGCLKNGRAKSVARDLITVMISTVY